MTQQKRDQNNKGQNNRWEKEDITSMIQLKKYLKIQLNKKEKLSQRPITPKIGLKLLQKKTTH